MNPQKTILNGQEYEFISAEVVSIDLAGNDKEKLYSIKCKLLNSIGSQSPFNVIQARPLDANIKNIPIVGEVVLLTKGPTSYSSVKNTGQEYYYTNPISIQSSVHHNGLPGVSEFLPTLKPSDQDTRNKTKDGIPIKSSKKVSTNSKIDTTFPQRLDVYPIQPYPGDIILEGRWGQSIRFGSTVDERRQYPIKPFWKKGLGETGNPILIISNGTNPERKPFNEFILEDADKDDSCIWMTSGQSVKITPASNYTPSISDKEVNLFGKNNFAGNQVIISSDRLIFNARKQEIVAFSKEGIGLSSEKAISLDAKQVVEMEGGKISLGLNAISPALLGDRTIEWLDRLCELIDKLIQEIVSETHPTGVGPSGIPINSSAYRSIKANFKSLRQKVRDLPSNLVFLNENAGGPSDRELNNSSNRESSGATTRLGTDYTTGTTGDPIDPSDEAS